MKLASADLRARLVGTWRLLTWEASDADGDHREPFGPHPLGYVVYTPDGRMITTISRAGRTPIGGDLLSAPVAGRSDAFASFVAYAGRFEVVGSADVVHHVELSLFPDWVGTSQRRQVQLSPDGNELVLRSEGMAAGGRPLRHELRWRRTQV